MSPRKTLTDYELALQHQYVTRHGRAPAPGFSAVNSLLEPPALKWAASEIAAKALLDPRGFDGLLADAREHLEARKGRPPLVKSVDGTVKHPWREASDEEIVVWWVRGSFDREWKAKADRGSRVHAVAEEWVAGRAVDVAPDEAGYVDALERFYGECKPEWVAVEQILLHPCPRDRDDLEYGGRSDFFCVLHDGPLPGVRIGDIKTGGHYAGSIGRQLAAYWLSAGTATYDADGALGPLAPLPRFDGAAALYLHGDGTYDLLDPFADIPLWTFYDQFLDLRSAYNLEQRLLQHDDERGKK